MFSFQTGSPSRRQPTPSNKKTPSKSETRANAVLSPTKTIITSPDPSANATTNYNNNNNSITSPRKGSNSISLSPELNVICGREWVDHVLNWLIQDFLRDLRFSISDFPKIYFIEGTFNSIIEKAPFFIQKHPQSKSLIFSTVTPQKKHCASSSIADAIAFFKAVPCLLSQSVIFGSPCLAALEASHIVSTSKGAFKRLNVNILEGIAYINFITRSGFCFALEISILVQFDIVSFYFDITVGSRSACLSIIYCCFGCVETRPHNIPLFSAVSFMILPFRTDFQP